MNDLSVITVTHQSAAFIEEQVLSVVSGGLKISMEQIIVDNASTDGTQDLLDSLGCKIIKNDKNVGFSAANNQALAHASGRYLLFLNPDMQVKQGSLDELISWMDVHKEVGIGSCVLVDALGMPLAKNSARPLPRLFGEILWLLRFDKERADASPEMVKGAFMLVRSELVNKLGFAFDPRYFLLYEDADLCREAKRLGYKIAVHSQVCCVDFNSRSFSVKSGEWIYHHFTRSMLQYFRKWEPWYCWIWIALLIPVGRWLRGIKKVEFNFSIFTIS